MINYKGTYPDDDEAEAQAQADQGDRGGRGKGKGKGGKFKGGRGKGGHGTAVLIDTSSHRSGKVAKGGKPKRDTVMLKRDLLVDVQVHALFLEYYASHIELSPAYRTTLKHPTTPSKNHPHTTPRHHPHTTTTLQRGHCLFEPKPEEPEKDEDEALKKQRLARAEVAAKEAAAAEEAAAALAAAEESETNATAAAAAAGSWVCLRRIHIGVPLRHACDAGGNSAGTSTDTSTDRPDVYLNPSVFVPAPAGLRGGRPMSLCETPPVLLRRGGLYVLTLPRALPLTDPANPANEVAVLLADARAPPAYLAPGLVRACR